MRDGERGKAKSTMRVTKKSGYHSASRATTGEPGARVEAPSRRRRGARKPSAVILRPQAACGRAAKKLGRREARFLAGLPRRRPLPDTRGRFSGCPCCRSTRTTARTTQVCGAASVVQHSRTKQLPESISSAIQLWEKPWSRRLRPADKYWASVCACQHSCPALLRPSYLSNQMFVCRTTSGRGGGTNDSQTG